MSDEFCATQIFSSQAAPRTRVRFPIFGIFATKKRQTAELDNTSPLCLSIHAQLSVEKRAVRIHLNYLEKTSLSDSNFLRDLIFSQETAHGLRFVVRFGHSYQKISKLASGRIHPKKRTAPSPHTHSASGVPRKATVCANTQASRLPHYDGGVHNSMPPSVDPGWPISPFCRSATVRRGG